ncbi:MAG: trigger factor [Simkaniaceae bacterium]|nr:trigger factor [Simkaniaceae bacterium]
MDQETEKKEENTLLSSEELSDNEIKLKIETHKNCHIKFFVTVGKEILVEGREAALKKIAKESSVPGFRKGKAPREMILKKFPDAVQRQERESAADVAFKKAQALAKKEILPGNNQISYDVNFYKPGEEAEFVFTFECEPQVPEIDPSKLDLSEVKSEVVDEARVNATLDQIRGFYSQTKPVEDRAAEEGDRVAVDIDDLDSDPPSKAFENQHLMVTDTGMSKWMRDLVVGMKVGDEKEGVSEPNEDDPEEVKKDFQKKKVKVTLKKIEKVEMPEVDDELAKKLGVDTVEQLKERLKEQLVKQVAEGKLHEEREAVAKQLVEKFPFELPMSLLSREIQQRAQSLFQNPNFQQGWAKKTEAEQEEFHKQLVEQATQSIMLFFLCRKVIMENDLTVEEPKASETPAHTSVLDSMFAERGTKDPASMSDEEKSLDLSRRMLQTAEDFLIAKVKKS